MDHEFPPTDPASLSAEDVGMLRQIADSGMVLVWAIRNAVRGEEFGSKKLEEMGGVAARSMGKAADIVKQAIVLKGLIAQDPEHWALKLVPRRRSPAETPAAAPRAAVSVTPPAVPVVPAVKPRLGSDLAPTLPRIPVERLFEDACHWLRHPTPEFAALGRTRAEMLGDTIRCLELDLEETRRFTETALRITGVTPIFPDAAEDTPPPAVPAWLLKLRQAIDPQGLATAGPIDTEPLPDG